MKISIAAFIVTAFIAGAAHAAPPAPPQAAKPKVVTCEQARPGTRLWHKCHPRKAPKVVKQPTTPHKPAPIQEKPARS